MPNTTLFLQIVGFDGTILSTATDAKELEPLIKKAFNLE